MKKVELLGHLAGILTTIAFLPQVIRIWKTRSTKDISLLMFSILLAGISLWLLYGLYLDSMPIILANGATFLLVLVIFYFKLKYK